MPETRRSLDVPAARAWRVLTDTTRWPEWGPSVRAVDCPTRFIGPGSVGRVQTAFGPWLSFRVTEWEDGRWWRWQVAGVPATGHGVTVTGPASCEIAFTVPAWAPFYLPVCAAALWRIERLCAVDQSAADQPGP